jgi:hypothetical protein
MVFLGLTQPLLMTLGLVVSALVRDTRDDEEQFSEPVSQKVPGLRGLRLVIADDHVAKPRPNGFLKFRQPR